MLTSPPMFISTSEPQSTQPSPSRYTAARFGRPAGRRSVVRQLHERSDLLPSIRLNGCGGLWPLLVAGVLQPLRLLPWKSVGRASGCGTSRRGANRRIGPPSGARIQWLHRGMVLESPGNHRGSRLLRGRLRGRHQDDRPILPKCPGFTGKDSQRKPFRFFQHAFFQKWR